MGTHDHKTATPARAPHKALIVLLTFLAITALGGGAALIARPDGSLLGLTPADLATNLLPDFRWPGLILFTLFGIGGGLALYGTIRNAWWGPKLAMLVGAGQVVWIITQVVMIREPSVLQAAFFAVGTAITALAAKANGHVWRTGHRAS